jgi:hypothetical protein
MYVASRDTKVGPLAGTSGIHSDEPHKPRYVSICRQHATITLLPVPSKATAAGIPDVGFQVLAVAGGQISLYGMPGGNSTPSWTRLTATAQPGDTTITVQGNVTSWLPGMKVT